MISTKFNYFFNFFFIEDALFYLKLIILIWMPYSHEIFHMQNEGGNTSKLSIWLSWLKQGMTQSTITFWIWSTANPPNLSNLVWETY